MANGLAESDSPMGKNGLAASDSQPGPNGLARSDSPVGRNGLAAPDDKGPGLLNTPTGTLTTRNF